jgi:homoserine O-succinyltransferase
MSDAALISTERQFMRLLEPAGHKLDINIRLFYLPEIVRGDGAQAQLRARYTPIDLMQHSGIDALIVTGCEPVRSNLSDEPYWPSLVQLIEWAKHHTISTVWSCLAAHAAVRHLDGIARRRLPTKLSGVYEFDRVGDHPLLRGIREPIHVPHSRLNGLASSDLVQAGYQLLTHSAVAGVDAFVKNDTSLFVFLQGHPEYDPDSLYREYRRDMTRFLAGQQETCPALPSGYFGRCASAALSAFAEKARAQRAPAFMEQFPAIADHPRTRNDWQVSATRLFANWLAYIADAKTQQARGADEHMII